MARPLILAYGLTSERLSRLKYVCMRLGMLARAVPEEDMGQPVGALCGVTERIADAPVAAVSEEMLVFCHMDNASVSRFLQMLRQQRIPPFGLKAMLTPVNAAWNAQQLCMELQQERAAIAAGNPAPHEG